MSTIAERVKKVRKSENLTQQKFAERIGVKQNTVAQYEMGRNIPMDTVITSICREFHVNESWLRYGTGKKESETTQKQKLARFFADVLATAPDDRSAFIAALADLPPEFWPLVLELAKNIAANIKKEED